MNVSKFKYSWASAGEDGSHICTTNSTFLQIKATSTVCFTPSVILETPCDESMSSLIMFTEAETVCNKQYRRNHFKTFLSTRGVEYRYEWSTRASCVLTCESCQTTLYLSLFVMNRVLSSRCVTPRYFLLLHSIPPQIKGNC